MQSVGIFIACVVVCELVGIIGGIATVTSVRTWYKKLKKPAFNPPPSIFGPVWTMLYALMGYGLYRIIITPCNNKQMLLSLFGLQLALNFLWSFIFFYYRKIFLAFVEIILMWLAIVGTLAAFWSVDRAAGLVLAPYFLWVSFATYLNGGIWIRNRKKQKRK